MTSKNSFSTQQPEISYINQSMSLRGIKLSFKASPPIQGQMQPPHHGLQVWHHLDLAHLFAIITPTWYFLFLEHNSPSHWGLLTGLEAVHRQLCLFIQILKASITTTERPPLTI